MKNIRLKLFLENNVFPLFSAINSWKKHDSKKILFYINSDFRENNKVLFDYMIANRYNNR